VSDALPGERRTRIAIAVLQPPVWAPPGVDPSAWRLALAEDVLDVFALMLEVDPAVAVATGEAGLAREVGWPGLRSYELSQLDLPSLFAAAEAEGYEQAVVIAADAPDLPGLHIAKLLRPLTSHPMAVAQVSGAETGLLGAAVRLPAPNWLPGLGLDELTPQHLRKLAPQASDVAAGAAWHRMRGAADLGRLDPRLEGWSATRALLS